MNKALQAVAVVCLLALSPAFGAPVKLSIIDVAGNLKLSKPAVEAFKVVNPQTVSDIEYIIATAPELVAK